MTPFSPNAREAVLTNSPSPPFSQFNSVLAQARRANANGVYDVHTNTVMYPASMQPTHARIEQVVDKEDAPQPTSPTIFPPVNPTISRNFMVTDVHMQTPPTGIAPSSYTVPFRSAADNAAAAGADFLAPFRGLRAVSMEIRDLLPDDCRKAFDEAVKKEEDWFEKWGDETDSTSRRPPVIDKAIVPYSIP